jgi:hypothetical protein
MEATSFLRQNKTLDPPTPSRMAMKRFYINLGIKRRKDSRVASLLADWPDRRMDADTLILAECLKSQILLVDREILINKFLFQELKKEMFLSLATFTCLQTSSSPLSSYYSV